MSSLFGLHYSFVIRHSDFVIFPRMTPARFQTIEEIFRAALEQKPDKISAFLDTACAGDEVLRRKVEVLLSSRERAADFMKTSAVGLATKIIQNEPWVSRPKSFKTGNAIRSSARRLATIKFLNR